MTRTEIERIAVVESQVKDVQGDVSEIKSDVKLLVAYMTAEKARRKGITEVFGVGRAASMLFIAAATLMVGLVNAAHVLGLV